MSDMEERILSQMILGKVEQEVLFAEYRLPAERTAELGAIIQKIDRTEYDRILDEEMAFNETLMEVERERQKGLLLTAMQERLPEGSSARLLLDAAVKRIQGKDNEPS